MLKAPAPRPREKTHFIGLRITLTAIKLIDEIQRKRGILRSSIIEEAIRDYAEKKGCST